MAYDMFGNWVEDTPQIDYSDPALAPPNSVWNGSGWTTTKPDEAGYDPTWGGYTTGDPRGESVGDQWLNSVYQYQGWELPALPGDDPNPDGGGDPGDPDPNNNNNPDPNNNNNPNPNNNNTNNNGTNYGGTSDGGYSMAGYPTMFDNPETQFFEDMLRQQIDRLQSPIEDPKRDQYMATLQQYYEALQNGDPQLAQLLQQQLDRLNAPVNDPQRDQYMAALQSQFQGLNGPNADFDALMGALRSQFQQFSQTPGYSEAERAMMNTQALEPIEALRAQSQRREMARTAQAGYLPTSGLANQRLSDADRYYDAQRTIANRELALRNIDQIRQDQARALQVGNQMWQTPQLRAGQASGVAGQLADVSQAARDEELRRQMQALGVAGTLRELPLQDMARSSDVASQMAALSQAARQEDLTRQMMALGVGGTLHKLPIEALNQAMAVYGASPSPSNLMTALSQMLQGDTANQNETYAIQNQQLGGYNQILGMLAALFG